MTTMIMAWNHALCHTDTQPKIFVLHPEPANAALRGETGRPVLHMSWKMTTDECGRARLTRTWSAQ